MIYPMTARTLKEAAEHNKSHDGYLPYLNAPRGMGQGYSSGSWAEDDRRLVMWIKVAFVAAVGGLICILAMI